MVLSKVKKCYKRVFEAYNSWGNESPTTAFTYSHGKIWAILRVYDAKQDMRYKNHK